MLHHRTTSTAQFALDDEHRARRMMDELRRDAAEYEAIESVKPLTPYHQEAIPFRREFQNRRRNRPLFFANLSHELQRRCLSQRILRGDRDADAQHADQHPESDWSERGLIFCWSELGARTASCGVRSVVITGGDSQCRSGPTIGGS